MPPTICDALRDLVLFVQFKKREKHPWRSVNFSTKSNTPPWVISRFLNYTNGTKSRKTSYLYNVFVEHIVANTALLLGNFLCQQNIQPETYLESSRTSTMELFYKNSEWP